jgi:hypothetical protein
MAEPEKARTAQAQANGTAKAPSKWAAVTQILAERGPSFTPTQIRDELKSRFGLEITLGTATTYKRDILRKQAEARGKATGQAPPRAKGELASSSVSKEETNAQAAPPAPVPASTAAPQAATETTNDSETSAARAQGSKTRKKPALSKKEAVRRAMEIAGPDATPTELRKVIRQRFRILMSNDHISNTKSAIRREMAAREAAMGKKEATEPAAATPPAAPQPESPVESGQPLGGYGLEDIRGARELLARLGAEKLKGLIDVLTE